VPGEVGLFFNLPDAIPTMITMTTSTMAVHNHHHLTTGLPTEGGTGGGDPANPGADGDALAGGGIAGAASSPAGGVGTLSLA